MAFPKFNSSTRSPLKNKMVGRCNFIFVSSPIFRCYLIVLGRESYETGSLDIFAAATHFRSHGTRFENTSLLIVEVIKAAAISQLLVGVKM